MGRALMIVLLLVPMWTQAQVPDLSGYEYWFDQADADNERTFIPFTTPGQTITLSNEQLLAAGLEIGPHRLHIRVRDEGGRWSSTLYRSFSIHAAGPFAIVSGEYWFDEDDQDRQVFTLTPGESVNVSLNTAAADLAVGQHRVHYRLRDEQGSWSSVLSKHFTISASGPFELVLLRYWSEQVETEPEDLTEVVIQPGVQYLEMMDDILFCEWSSTGNTDVFFQLKDNQARWSSVIMRSIDVDAVSTPPVSTSLSGPTLVLDNSEQTYTANTVPGASYYVWTLPAGWSGSSSGNTINVTSGDPGDDGWVVVAAGNGCGTGEPDSLFVTITGTSISHDEAAGIQLFPNPTNGLVTIILPAGALTDRLLVLNAMGQVVRDEPAAQTERFILDLSGEGDGVYTVRLFHRDGWNDLRVMVQQ